MLEKDATIGNVKHEVLYKVAKLAFAAELKEKEEQIPFDIIPGPQANFRCCIYREREIIRERVRLAQGKPAGSNSNNKNTVQVIKSACEGCPITRFVVTDNCQKCMSKKCQQACHFNAITMLRDRAFIDPQNCKECGMCAKACPYNAIADLMRPCKRSCPVDAISMDENHIVVIDEEKCIRCGACIKDCPFGAIADRSSMVDVINEINMGKKVYAMIAPAGEGQFGSHVSMGVLAEACKSLGFEEMYEVALGGDMVADSEAAEWAEAYKEGKKMTTSCCPAFVNMIQKHFPQVYENMSTTISPMAAVHRYIRSMEPEAVTVFIGPCIAKKSEVCTSQGKDNADYALTFEELYAMLKAKDVNLSSFGSNRQQASIYGKRFANAGGVTNAVLKALEEQGESTDIKVRQCNGAMECKKALALLKNGKLPEDFIEGMICEGGCVNGPGSIKRELQAKKDREKLLLAADGRGIEENLNKFEAEKISMHRKE
ncbi:4Fe-4S dicluster domain-containing protein [Anaeromicropila populeti]|uniref:Ferredoxin hydrogenase large subunit n=1 Tax=Anaeromicropila populeti TaxID=37658 RepID=A0A1I6IXA8_9FIRM|nr:4Fe-4S dicluster domain-containing protein [Anaeromicropila populeti]SFR71309.1 ferredoxin hydrogenase large subunit [Anaeromicropila populeti]